MTGLGEGVPGDVEPGGTGEELVGEGVGLEEVDEALELGGIFGADVGGLTKKVLGILDTPYLAIDGLITKARINDDRAHNLTGRLQQLMTAISQIRHNLHRRNILRIFLQVQKLAQLKMRRQPDVIEILFHGIVF